jgi:Carboxypeptidase regulatory-like domain
MNASFSILQKLKTQFFQTIPNKTDYHVAFAPFAFTLSNDDFYFLKNNLQSGSEARKYLKEQSEFSFTSNSVLRKPNIWSVDSDNLLYNSYKNILENALIIDPDVLTQEETAKLEIAKNVLFDSEGNDSVKYAAYKTYAVRSFELDKRIIDHNALRSAIAPTDTSALERWNVDFTSLTNQKKELQIEWQVKGFKSAVESSKTVYDTIIFGKSSFIEKWNDAKNIKLASPNLQTDEFGVEFLVTTCIPNSICDFQSPIWKKVTISKPEIAQLTQSFTEQVPAAVLQEFGDLQPELDSITFEYCIIDIIRPWFDETILNNRYWKLQDNSTVVSSGDDTMSGQIPAYPVKIILSKNIDLVFTPNSPVNEEIKTKLKNGNRLFFGSLMLKTIPSNMEDKKINSYRIQQLSNKELSVITKVAVQNTNTTAKFNNTSKFKMIELLNHRPQTEVKRNVETRSITAMNIVGMNIGKNDFQEKAELRNISTEFTQNPKAVSKGFFPLFKKNIPIAVVPPIIKRPPFTPPPPPPPPPPKTTSAITGKIFDNTNKPIPVVEIQIMNVNNASTQSVLSLEDGTYNFQNIENAVYQFKVRKTGYTIQEKNIDVRSNSTQDFLLELQPVPTETFQVMGVICKKMPKLPNPLPDGSYI